MGIDQDTEERLQKWSVHGIVEYEDGTVEREWPSAIRFADSAEYFGNMAWEQMEARRDAMDSEKRPAPEEVAAEGGETYEINAMCHSCANEPQYIEPCLAADYDCAYTCKEICVCRTCFDNSNWKPKEAANG